MTGKGFSTQANMMALEGVPEAMAEAFSGASGPLAARIMTALEAAQQAGGDIRGSQSAAILVREPGPLSATWDLRIDNSPDPLGDLRALLNIRLAGAALAESRIPDSASLTAAMAAYEEACRLSSSDEQTFWFAVDTLTRIGQEGKAEELLRDLFAHSPQWEELLMRLTLPGALTLKPRFAPDRAP